jgi:ATP adenylyltransferase
MICPICAWSSDNKEYLFIHESNYWRIVLAPNQLLLGRCVIQLKRHCGDIAEINIDEALEWQHIIVTMENALKTAFNATMFNWSCLMNLSYQEDIPNPHIHWWVVPRYNHTIKINKYLFEDTRFGYPYDDKKKFELPIDIRKQIVEQIRNSLKKQN